jgi:hypothetical protein
MSLSIGSARSDAVDIFAHFGLAPFRQILTPEDFVVIAAQTGCAPLRKRPLNPEVLVWLMLGVALQVSSFTQGLQHAWGLVRACCPCLKQTCVKEEAFCQARRALSFDFWRALWGCLREKFERRFGAALLWKGLRPLACDGSELDLPNVPPLVKFFTRPKTQKGVSRAPQARLVALCSVLTGYCVDFVCISRRFSEHIALKHLIRRLRPNDLLLNDKGFFSYQALASIPARGAHFLMRVSDQAQGRATRLASLGEDDWIVEFAVSARMRRKHPELPERLRCRLLRYQIKGYRPSWLLTSLLDPSAFSRSELVSLYHWRWRIETIYRELKHVLNIQNLRSLTPAGIGKEIYAHLLLVNLIRWTMSEAAEGTGKTALEYSFTNAVQAVRDALLVLFRARAPALSKVYEHLLQDIRAAPIRQRPGRSYPRRRDGKAKNKGHGKYLLPAKLQTLA